MTFKKQLLDPIGTICRMIALNFNEKNTKISIQDHVLKIQKPTGVQFIIRLYNGDGKENVSELYYSIIRVVQWYLVPNPNNKINNEYHEVEDEHEHIVLSNAEEISRSAEFKNMIEYLCMALKRLQQTYQTGNVIFAIQFFINLLQKGVKGEYDENDLPLSVLSENENDTLLDYEKIKNLWDLKRIKRICELYDACFAVQNDAETDDITREAIIDGYLRSINAILDITDVEFQKLIMYSNQG